MKTLELIYTNGKYDIKINGRSSSVLDSNIKSDRIKMAEQRVVKAVRSKQNIFEPTYGINISSYIGQKTSSFLLLKMAFDKLLKFYADNLQFSGNAAIRTLNLEYENDDTILCEIVLPTDRTEVQV